MDPYETTIIFISDNSSFNNKEVKTSNPEKMDSPDTLNPEQVVDTIDHDTTELVKKAPVKKDTSKEKKKRKTEDNSINIEEAVDVKKYRDERDDPNYIETPCEIVNGECIRHNHKEQ